MDTSSVAFDDLYRTILSSRICCRCAKQIAVAISMRYKHRGKWEPTCANCTQHRDVVYDMTIEDLANEDKLMTWVEHLINKRWFSTLQFMIVVAAILPQYSEMRDSLLHSAIDREQKMLRRYNPSITPLYPGDRTGL